MDSLMNNTEVAEWARNNWRAYKADYGVLIAAANIVAASMTVMSFVGTHQMLLAMFWFGIFITGNGFALLQIMQQRAQSRAQEINDASKIEAHGSGAQDQVTQDAADQRAGDQAIGKKTTAKSKHTNLNPLTATLLNASVWSAMPVILFPAAEPAQKVLVACVIAGIMGAGAFAISFATRAALGYVLIISAGGFIALMQEPDTVYSITAIMFALYAGTLCWVVRSQARSSAERLRIQSELAKSNELVSTLLNEYEENGQEWLWETDKSMRLRNVSAKVSEMTGIPISNLEGSVLTDIFVTRHYSPDRSARQHNANELEIVSSAIETEKPFRDCLVLSLNDDGGPAWWRLTGRPVYTPEGDYIGYRGVCHDVTEKKTAEDRMHYMAHYDVLTGLPNRANFTIELGDKINVMRSSYKPFALMILDLDKFKHINDTMGHPAGDAVLIEAASRLKDAVGDKGYVARLGGDEFAILFHAMTSPRSVAALARNIIDRFSVPMAIEGRNITVEASVGIAIGPDDGFEKGDLVKNADLALYRAKEDKCGSFRFFMAEMDLKVRESRELEMELRDALEQNELCLWYQPILSVRDNVICGFEALIRWNHATRGMINPAQFIPIAEETGLIVKIGEFVINQACNEAASWRNNRRIAVNLSVQQFAGVELESVVATALANSGLHPSRLELEVTESILIDNKERTLSTLENLRAMGVRISLDDFGTGYSSLSYLVSYPFDKLKIDKSFVDQAVDSPDRLAIIKAIIGLAKSLGITTTAEGVEHIDQFRLLAQEGCNEIQGYLVNRPLPSHQIDTLVSQKHDATGGNILVNRHVA